MPYTYLLTHLPSGKKYYGVRYAKNCKPEYLWVTYFSSSRHIKKLIEIDGKDSFLAEVRKVFKNSTDAISWETRVLIRLKVPYNPNFLNVAKNHPPSQHEKEVGMTRTYGVSNPSQHPELRKKAVESWIERYGVDNPGKSHEVHQKKIETLQDRYGVNSSWLIPGVLEKSKNTRKENLGVEWAMQNKDVVEKSKKTQFEKFGDWKINTDSVKQTREKTNTDRYGARNPITDSELHKKFMLEKYGVENWSQTESGKKSISDSWDRRQLMICPHCNKSSKAFSNMNRWHFDNCKYKPI